MPAKATSGVKSTSAKSTTEKARLPRASGVENGVHGPTSGQLSDGSAIPMSPKTETIKLSDYATTLEEARGVIDRQEAFIEQLRKDKARLDWLADPQNTIGNVTLPRQHIMDHPDSMRAAIDAAMEGDK